MILLCKLAAAVFVAAVLTLLLKKDQPAFAFLVSACTAAGLLAVVVQQVCFKFISRMLSATFAGSFGSNGSGLPVNVLQKRQERVQISPAIIKVAVPLLQHSPIFGHFPLVQIVCRQWDSTMLFVRVNCSFPPSRIFNQSGFLKCSDIISYKLSNKKLDILVYR